MDIDREALVAYYRRGDLLREARQARLARIVAARQWPNALRASALDLLCRLQIPTLEPACALAV